MQTIRVLNVAGWITNCTRTGTSCLEVMNQWWKRVCRVRSLGSSLPSYEPAAPWSFLFLLLLDLNWFLGLASFRNLWGMFLPRGSCTAFFLVQGVISRLSTGPAFTLLWGLYSNAVAPVSLPLPSCLQLSFLCLPQLPATSKSPMPAWADESLPILLSLVDSATQKVLLSSTQKASVAPHGGAVTICGCKVKPRLCGFVLVGLHWWAPRGGAIALLGFTSFAGRLHQS